MLHSMIAADRMVCIVVDRKVHKVVEPLQPLVEVMVHNRILGTMVHTVVDRQGCSLLEVALVVASSSSLEASSYLLVDSMMLGIQLDRIEVGIVVGNQLEVGKPEVAKLAL